MKRKKRKDINYVGYTYNRDYDSQKDGFVYALEVLDIVNQSMKNNNNIPNANSINTNKRAVADENNNYNSNKNPNVNQTNNELTSIARNNPNHSTSSNRNKAESNYIEHYNNTTQVNNNVQMKKVMKQSPSFEKQSTIPIQSTKENNKKIIQIERSKPSKSPETTLGININYYSNNPSLSSKNNFLYKPISIAQSERMKTSESLIKPTDSSSKIPTPKCIIKAPMVYIPHQKQFHIKTEGNGNSNGNGIIIGPTTFGSLRNYTAMLKQNSNTPKLVASNRIQMLYKKK